MVLLIGLSAFNGQPESARVDCTELDSYRIPVDQFMAEFQAYVSRLDLEDPASRSVAERSIQGLLEKDRAVPCADHHPEKQADLEGASLGFRQAVENAKRGDRIDLFHSMEKVKEHIHSFNDWSGVEE